MSTVAHLNWGTLVAPWEDPAVAEFVNNVGRVNDAAERSPGFVWRKPNDEMDAEYNALEGLGPLDRLAATLSVWESAADLDTFVMRTIHGRFLARRENWFEPSNGPSHVVWPIEDRHRPTLNEARARVDRMIANGPTQDAYNLAWWREHSEQAA